MKTKTKTLLITMCAIMLVAATVFGTMAYLTDNDSATNTFTVGNVDIKLDEAPVNDNGKETDGERVKGNRYKLLPGCEYDKDPTVTVMKGSEECYVRMLVTVSDIDALKNAMPEFVSDDGLFLLEKVVGGWDNNTWKSTSYADGTYEFRYKETVDASSAEENIVLPALFTTVKIPGTIDNDHLVYLKNVKIDVKGQAIQVASFANADAAWATFAG